MFQYNETVSSFKWIGYTSLLALLVHYIHQIKGMKPNIIASETHYIFNSSNFGPWHFPAIPHFEDLVDPWIGVIECACLKNGLNIYKYFWGNIYRQVVSVIMKLLMSRSYWFYNQKSNYISEIEISGAKWNQHKAENYLQRNRSCLTLWLHYL